MKIMIESTSFFEPETMIKKYPCLKNYNLGYDVVNRRLYSGSTLDENGKRIQTYTLKEITRPYIMLDTLDALQKLLDDLKASVDNPDSVCIILNYDYDVEDRLCIEIYDGYRE